MKETGGTVRDDSWEVDSHVPSSIPLSPGDRLGAYVVIRLIGRGAIGLVYLAEDSQTKVQVAIKILRPDSVLQRFDRLYEIRQTDRASVGTQRIITEQAAVGREVGLEVADLEEFFHQNE